MTPTTPQNPDLESLSPGRRRSSPSTMTATIRTPRTVTHAQRQGLDRTVELYLRECFRRATRGTVAEFAAFVGRNADYVTRRGAEILGASLLGYLRGKQLEEAERLITVTTLTIKEIALRAGFGTVSTFYRHFRAAYGMSPRAFRQVRK